MHLILTVSNLPIQISRKLFKKYEACKKVYIPKEEYFLIIDQLKMIPVDSIP